MGTFIDLTDQSFGELIVIKVHKNRKRNGKPYIRWHCLCKCGNKTIVPSLDLKTGHTKSCGCLKKKGNRRTHGMSHTNEYSIWCDVKGRCLNKKNHAYSYYGGRGIKMDKKWANSFDAFYEYMGPRPSLEYSLDRYPDVNGNYEPGNCRWGSDEEQSRNKRSNVWIEYNGIRMVQKDWAKYFGVTHSTIQFHLKRRSMGEIHEFYASKRR